MKSRGRAKSPGSAGLFILTLPWVFLFLGVQECPTELDSDGDGYTIGEGDCNDEDPAVYPGALEVCDGKDNNCDRLIDEGISDLYYQDVDADGFGVDDSAMFTCDPPDGYVLLGGDCNDEDASIYPTAEETCDGLDNDCDNSVDEGLPVYAQYPDVDADGYGDPASPQQACGDLEGFANNGDDCDDDNPAVNPGATELCDSVDNDCDGATDEGVTTTWYLDGDEDGYGTSTTTEACSQPAGYASVDGDCNDADGSISPGAAEQCDGIDNDCNGQVDDGVATSIWYADGDGDGYGDAGTEIEDCGQPAGYVGNGDDCDDSDAGTNPGATELCDGIDNDCDGVADGPDSADAGTWFADQDGDTFGNLEDVVTACEPPDGFVANGDDCDDDNGSINPGAQELCDGFDNNCDGSIDGEDAADAITWFTDNDGDAFGDPNVSLTACEQPDGFVPDASDCNDDMWYVNPDGLELCNGLDDDCDGLKDSADTWGDNTTGDLALLNDNCDSFDRLLAGENEVTVAEYWSAWQGEGTEVYPVPLWVGGHTPGAAPPTSEWPADCVYYDLNLFYGHPEDNPELDTRPAKLCFSRGTDIDGMDEVYAEMTAEGITVQGVLDNEPDDDGPELDYVFYSPEESTARFAVWYISDSFSASGGRGALAWSILTEFYDVRIVLDLQPGS